MTTTAPDGPAPGGALSARPAPARPRRGRRRVVVGVVLAVLALVGFAVRAFASEGGFTGSRIGRTVDCGELEQCIPGLQGDDVVSALEAEGHTCERDPALGDMCTLEVGFTIYQVSMRAPDGGDGITSLSAELFRPDEGQAGGYPADTPAPAGAIPYFSWFAALPYGNDTASSEEITTWLRQQIEGGKSAEIQFGDYRYEVTYDRPGDISLFVRAERPIAS